MNEEMEAFELSYPSTEESAFSSDKKFPPVPEGVYWVDIARVNHKAHARGPMFGLFLSITEDPLNEKSVNKKLWTNVIFLPYYSDKAKKNVTPGAGIARQFLKAIGEQYKGESIKVNPKAWLGKSLGIRVKHDGQGRENVKAFFTADDYRKAVEAPKVEALPEEAIF